MTRKEKIREAAEHYEQVVATNLACEYGWRDCDIQQQCFKAGVEWVDKNPIEGLWDSEKVMLFLIGAFKELPNGYGTFKLKKECSMEQLLEDLRKAMEE